MAGIYIHIPFCKQKCTYCNFYSIANLRLKDDFLIALGLEIELRKSVFENEIIDTIYFGGGTPSVLTKEEITRIIDLIYENFKISESPEITFEANPDDLTQTYIQQLAETKINRLSIGVQSFDDNILKQINRRHSAKQAIKAIEYSQEAGFSNLSIDLIYGIPNQSDDVWLQNLNIALNYKIPHLSCYSLTVEKHTALQKLIEKKRIEMPSEEDSIRQFNILMDFAKTSGYRQYEISNYCLEDQVSRHNSAYWNGIPYLGFGPGAHSFITTNRQWNVSNVKCYIEGINSNMPDVEQETLSLDDRYNEYVITSIRTDSGCSYKKINTDFGEKYFNYFCTQLKNIDSQLFLSKDGVIFLTQEGKHFADFVTRELFF
jgi:oxygen-independent coproporphyrinogen-3 oxidase